MPIAKYFIFVGSALLDLLLCAGFWFSDIREARSDSPRDYREPVILIEAEPKWPEKIVFDTSSSASASVSDDEKDSDVAEVEQIAPREVIDVPTLRQEAVVRVSAQPPPSKVRIARHHRRVKHRRSRPRRMKQSPASEWAFSPGGF